MRRGGAGLIAAVLALAGCKNTDTKPFGKEPTGTNASRAKTKDGKDAPPKWLDPSAGLPGSTTGVPKAKNWSNDPKAAAQDAVGGKVVDASGRPAKNVFIRVDAANAPAGGAPGAGALGIMTDQNGYFFTRGLKPGQAYNLTAEATQEGKQLTGTMQTRVPNPIITIVLREDNGLPPGGNPRPAGGSSDDFPPPPADSENIPPMGLGAPHTPRPTPGDSAFAPGNGANRPVPATIGTPPGIVPPVGPLPQPDDLSNPSRPARPENVADGPRSPFTPPAVSIPGPPGLPPSLPNPVLPKEQPDRKQGVRPGANFMLIDSLERNWDFATDRSGSVVLLEFVTTSCVNCKPAVPVLRDLQSRYAADGLQVVAVLCDEAPLRQRAAAAAKYARDNNTNYAVYVEPGAQTGAVRDRFNVEGYPTAVLLDSTGAVLWKGHPAKRADIEAAVRRAVGR
jgi:thiol-disulfide isomerase/thioredoxin